MQAQSSNELLLSRKRKRDGSNGEMEEGERTGKIPRCTVVSQLSRSSRFVTCSNHSDYLYTLTYVQMSLKGERSETVISNVCYLTSFPLCSANSYYLNLVMTMMLMMVFQGLRHPAPFSDDLEPVDKPYKRVSMDEATQGTSREWDFQKNVPSPQIALTFPPIMLVF